MNLALPDVRLARPADAQAIATMSREHIEAGLSCRWTPDRVQRAIEDRSCNVAVIDDRAAIAAFGIMLYAEETAHLALLAVAPTRRRQGLGTHLLQWLELPARMAGILELRLEVRADNPWAMDFYRRFGFVSDLTLRGYYQGRIDALRMIKPLAPAVP
ncbi:MAG TPA: GNAT family N-acetyltransferase [Steroidobacteraceae bacterium]|jgi:ribosomal-protein-alanine N-acetyltransferase|nr:GNAT family N-acetyltransferase [Steroidobacteraceae bacterium]